MYVVEWWQLWPQIEPRPWTGADGKPEVLQTLEEAVRRKQELYADERYNHLAFRVREV